LLCLLELCAYVRTTESIVNFLEKFNTFFGGGAS
jgi:hypothetical protein